MEINNNRKDWALEKLGDFADYEKGKKPKSQLPPHRMRGHVGIGSFFSGKTKIESSD